MKKIILVITAIITIQLAYSQQINNVAVVSVNVNEKVNTDFSTGDVAFIREITGSDKKFSTMDQLSVYHDLIFGELQKELPFKLVDESVVLKNEKYQSFEAVYGEDLNKTDIAYDGYKVISKLRDKEAEAMIGMFENTDAVMIVNLNFTLMENTMAANTGMGAATAVAYLNIKVIDKSGKAILKLRGIGESDGKVKVAMNKVTEKSMVDVPEILNEAADALLADTKKNLPKRIEKMYKKLK
jgi:hypothetical protein